jgi:hypothetical protein
VDVAGILRDGCGGDLTFFPIYGMQWFLILTLEVG